MTGDLNSNFVFPKATCTHLYDGVDRAGSCCNLKYKAVFNGGIETNQATVTYDSITSKFVLSKVNRFLINSMYWKIKVSND